MTLDEAIKENIDDLKAIIKTYKEEVNDKDFENVYAGILDRNLTAAFTALLLKNGINPLEYMSDVPEDFATSLDIEEIVIPNNILSIGIFAFAGCKNLKKIIIPDNVANISFGAFDKCSSLIEITIPSSITNIGTGVFYNCNSLTDVYYEGSEEDWNKIKIEWHNDVLLNANIHYNS